MSQDEGIEEILESLDNVFVRLILVSKRRNNLPAHHGAARTLPRHQFSDFILYITVAMLAIVSIPGRINQRKLAATGTASQRYVPLPSHVLAADERVG
ncbi:MAG: hypothetical protein KF774_21585, partial [Planctomyces sp.]|nr:hypothetical protein [Planctomyces sp.]